MPFRIKNNKKYPAEIIYFHRPLEIYFKQIFAACFVVQSIAELYETDVNGGYKTMPHMLSMILTKDPNPYTKSGNSLYHKESLQKQDSPPG